MLAFSQNLVPNPGFEEFYSCPGYFSQRITDFRAKEWTSAGTGTPDLFNACSEGEADVPYNWAGVSDAFDGEGFAGIYTWMNSDNQYREYLQSKLRAPLIKDSTYRIEFHYRLSSYSKYSVDRIGLMLSDSLLHIPDDQVIRHLPVLSSVQDSALTRETGLWETASMQYKAAGGEHYLIIGNFFDNETTHYYCIQSRPVQQDMLAWSSYYYVDAVEVVPVYDSIEKEAPEAIPYFKEEVKLNTTYVLNTIQFGFNSSELTSASFEELNKLADLLQKNSQLNVQISGYTDDVGSDDYNYILSVNRAKAVLEFLVCQNIDRKRVQIFGFGKSKPLFRNVSEEKRKANRRVEVNFLQ